MCIFICVTIHILYVDLEWVEIDVFINGYYLIFAMRILNLTQHYASQDQVEAGVYEPADKGLVQGLLTFNAIPTKDVLMDCAKSLASVGEMEGATHCMIGGAPFFMSYLEYALILVGITPVYAFSVRESVDQEQADGSVRKVAVFKHMGFVGL